MEDGFAGHMRANERQKNTYGMLLVTILAFETICDEC